MNERADLPKRPRILPPVFAVATLILMLVLHFFCPVAHIVTGPVRYLGLVLIVVSLAFGIWARTLFARAGTTVKPFQESSTLVVRGPFHVTRNPMYLTMTLVLVGVAIFLGSFTPFLYIPVFVIIIDRRFIPVEERMLEERFGESYRNYKSRVRRWI